MSRRTLIALLAATSIVLVLALGTFATPAPPDGDAVAAGPVGTRNDLPVVARVRVAADQDAPPARSVLPPVVLAVVALVLLVATGGGRHLPGGSTAVTPPRHRTRPPDRGPPVLLAG